MYLVSFGVYKRRNPEIACQSAKGARDLVDMLFGGGVKMRFILVIMVLGVLASTQAKSRKKSIKDEASLSSSILNKKLTGKSTKPSSPPAILAIEIVDPNENKTSNRNTKRTIDSALGYGYQNNYQPPPRYEVYKYSQHDIPPSQGHSLNSLSQGIQTHNFDIQKSISYNLQPPQPNLNQYYQPGTTLFSTVNNQGQVGGLSSHVPQNGGGHLDPQVPVIILRVYPSQLNDPSSILHPNLPQSHPLASTINSIDIQSLLTKYVQKVLITENNQQNHQGGYQYEPPSYQQQYQQEPHHNHDPDLLTHENYPKDTHTRVIFRTDKNQAGVSAERAMLPVAIPPIHGPPDSKPTTFRIHVPDSFSSVEVHTPEMQYGYTMQDNNQGSYYYNNNDEVSQQQPQQHQEQTYYYQEEGQNQYQQYQEQQEQVQVQPQQYENPTGADYQQQSYDSNLDSAPYNYHAHQKRAQTSRKNSLSRLIPEASNIKEIGRLKLIKA